MTFGTVLERNKGIGPGFDILRIALACVIFYGHVKWATGHGRIVAAKAVAVAAPPAEWADDWKRAILVSFVPAFFALSGYLVSASAVRTNVVQTFLAHRALRIFPALIVEVGLSAVLIGLFVTTLPMDEYFTDPQFFRYLLNAVGHITFHLPGVFETNPAPGIVNANLWTLPAEFYCYLIIAGLIWTGWFYSRRLVTTLVVGVGVVLGLMNGFSDFAVPRTTMPSLVVVYYFFVGSLFYQWRRHVPMRWPVFALACVLALLIQGNRHLVFLACPFVTYAILFVGHLPLPKFRLLATGDYSYGVYLFGFPITQTIVALAPSLRANTPAVLVLASVATLIFSVLSWHLIEKHMLVLKRRLPERYFPRAKRTLPATPEAREDAIRGDTPPGDTPLPVALQSS